ncbi:uncharacterized protein F4812DRAFT_146301 [Daldinia caldariorum]|uniref:uncharacterized protein n=1 Tax=Daldinia caldariorum TaxID=326644 RepID=UPI002008326A|nr:uncharacterized protein F4812DRAFT_146301 [Daldinia caldariorum]KAI1464958.1 hypothetical protein F4812DRAFT_146301 [Daldinia caldariorum]
MDAILDPKFVQPTILHSIDPRKASISHELVIIPKSASNSSDMSHQKVPITFTYKKDEVDPPIYVAGSFSDPPWQPQEMDVAIDQHGGRLFTKQVMVDDGTEIYYKFRIGQGDWWALDETADTATDEWGNTNNILRVSINGVQDDASKEAKKPSVGELDGSPINGGTQTLDIAQVAAEVADSARSLDPETPEPEISDAEAGSIGVRRMSSTPIAQVSETAIEVANVAATLDADESAVDDDDGAETNICPMFTHESIGPASHKEDVSDHAVDEDVRENKSHSESGNPAKEIENLDFDDPQLEEFPSDNKESILAAVRRISTSIDADRTVVDGIPQAPMVTILQNHKNVESLDKSSEPSGLSDSLSDNSQDLHPDDIVRQAHSGPKEPSTTSLGSISEDDEAHNENATDETQDATAPFIQHPGPSWRSPTPDRAASDDDKDEGIAMRVDSKKRAEESQLASPHLPSPPASDSNLEEAIILDPEESALEVLAVDVTPEEDTAASVAYDNNLPVTDNDFAKPSPSIATRNTPERHISDISNAESTRETEAKTTSLGTTSPPGLRKRIIERPATPPSMHHSENHHKYPAWLEACLRIVFVKWIGGLASWLHGRRNRALMAAGTAAIVVGVGLLWQNPVRL